MATQIEARITRAGVLAPTPWITLSGSTFTALHIEDGRVKVEARVAGLSSTLKHHPQTVVPVLVRSSRPRTRIIEEETVATLDTVNVSVATESGAFGCGHPCSVEAVYYSFDGKKWQRSPGQQLTLQGVAVGARRLFVAVEDVAGNVDTQPVTLSWVTPDLGGDNRSLYLKAGPPRVGVAIGTRTAFTVGGWAQSGYSWRVDGGDWTWAEGTPTMHYRSDSVGLHVWEALPSNVSNALWTGPPLVHMWSVSDDASSDFLRLSLQDGPHHLLARATDVAGCFYLCPHITLLGVLITDVFLSCFPVSRQRRPWK